MSRDRAIELDEDIAKVVRFMERNVTADRLQQVASHIPEVAALIWSPDRCTGLYKEPIRASARRSDASESVLAGTCVGDGSAEAMRDRPHQ